MNQLLDVVVKINDSTEIVEFHSLVIHQQIFGINTLNLEVDETVIEEGDSGFMGTAKDMIGKKLTVSLSGPKDNGDTLIFKGVITGTGCSATAETTHINIKAEGAETIMNHGLVKKVYKDSSIKDVAQKITGQYPKSTLDVKVDADGLASSMKTTFIQYNETDYEFLKRLANFAGCWFFNNGVDSVFGKAPSGSPIELILGAGLESFEVQTKSGGADHEADTYNEKDNKIQKGKVQGASGMDALTQSAYNGTKNSFRPTSNYHVSSALENQDLLNKFLQVKSNQEIAEMNTISGSSIETKLKVGDTVKVKRNTSTAVGEYRIVSLQIVINGEGGYTNHFTGIGYSESAPRSTYTQPAIPSEMHATVTDVNDPDGLGKVKVSLHWQESKEDYGWLQVSAPSAGDDSGFYFRPEVNSLVAVSINETIGIKRNFVMGALHNGKAEPKRWKHRENHIKGFRTPEGNELLLEDKGNDGRAISLQTKDDDGNYLWIADNNGTTEIYLRSKGIKLMAENDLEISAGGKLILQGTDVKISSGKTSVSKDSATQGGAMAVIELKSAGDVKIDSKSKVEVAAMMDVKISATANFTASANIAAEVSGMASSTLKSSGVLTIQGTLVKIN